MLRRLTPVLALIAGLAGGLLSRYIAPIPVHAQAPTPLPAPTPPPPPAPAVPLNIRAESFTLVGANGMVVGTFRPIPPVSRRGVSGGVELIGPDGRVLWQAGAAIRPVPLSQ